MYHLVMTNIAMENCPFIDGLLFSKYQDVSVFLDIYHPVTCFGSQCLPSHGLVHGNSKNIGDLLERRLKSSWASEKYW